jgi:hypothetical protein
MKTKYINAQKHRVHQIFHIIRFLKMIRGKFILINCREKEL